MPAQPAYDRLFRAALSTAIEHLRAEAAQNPDLSGDAAHAESVLTAIARPARGHRPGASVRDDLMTILSAAGHALQAASEPSTEAEYPLTGDLVARIRASALRDAAARYDQMTEGEWLHYATSRYAAGHDIPAQWLRDLANQEVAQARTLPLTEAILAVLELHFPNRSVIISAPEDLTPIEASYHRDGDWSSFRERTDMIIALRRAAAVEAIVSLIEGGQR